MSATLTMDTIEDADLVVSTNPGESVRIRTGMVTDIDIAGDPDPLVLEKALQVQGMPQLGQSGPYGALWRVSQIHIKPLFNDAVKVYIRYEPLNFGGQPTAYIVTEGSAMVEDYISIHPVFGAVRIGYRINGSNSFQIPAQTLTMNVPLPLRKISVSAIQAGNPNSATVQNYTGCVNSDIWPIGMAELPGGYWLMDDFSLSASKYTGYYQLRASAMTRSNRDWMMQGILTDTSTGRYVSPSDLNGNPLSDDVHQGILKAKITGRPYSYETPYTASELGAISVGWYPQVRFADVFGFGGG